MKELQEKVQKMLDGEQKRRTIAVTFLQQLATMLQDVCMELYGHSGNDQEIDTEAIWLRTSEKKQEWVYYRYGRHYTRDKVEDIGFYAIDIWRQYIPCWGVEVSELKGKDFWGAIRVIIDWIPSLIDDIEKRTTSRDALVERLRKLSE